MKLVHQLTITASFVLALSFPALAETLSGRVVHVADGDTITVLDASNQQHKIRLAGIDAPERKQAYGNASKKNLSDLVAGKSVTVDWNKLDKYKRVVGKVLLDSQDICLEQIRAGMAWHYKKYENEQPLEDRKRYSDAEKEARASQLGLWRDKSPIPPWEYRQMRKMVQ